MDYSRLVALAHAETTRRADGHPHAEHRLVASRTPDRTGTTQAATPGQAAPTRPWRRTLRALGRPPASDCGS